MRPKIKSIRIDVTVEPNETVRKFVSFNRWTRWTKTQRGHRIVDFSSTLFCHPTTASIARCRRAQDKAAGKDVDIFGARAAVAAGSETMAHFAGVMKRAVAEEYLSERADDRIGGGNHAAH